MKSDKRSLLVTTKFYLVLTTIIANTAPTFVFTQWSITWNNDEPLTVIHEPFSLETLKTRIGTRTAEVKKLNLCKAGIQTLPSGAFDAFENLEELSLSDNKLTTLPHDLFKNIPSLKMLDLGHNNIKHLPAHLFDALRNLVALDLGSNEFTNLPPLLFDQLTTLRTLQLSDNNKLVMPIVESKWYYTEDDIQKLKRDLKDLNKDIRFYKNYKENNEKQDFIKKLMHTYHIELNDDNITMIRDYLEQHAPAPESSVATKAAKPCPQKG